VTEEREGEGAAATEPVSTGEADLRDNAAPDPGTAADAPVQVAHFRSAPGPSMPFWIALALAILGLFVFVLSASALFVFGIGVALSFFLVPVVNWLTRHGWNRILASIVVVGAAVVTAIAVFVGVSLVLLNQGVKFLQNLPIYLEDLADWYVGLDLPDWLRVGMDALIVAIQTNLAEIDQASIIAGVVGGFVSFVGGLFAWMLLPFFMFYLVKDQPKMSGTFYERVPAPWAEDVGHMLTITVGNIAKYFKAEFIVGSIMFATVTIGMFVIGWFTDSPLLIQFAILLGVIALVMELIPQIGPILSYIPALILAIPSGVDAIVLVSVFYFIIFNIEGSILVPTFEGQMISFTGATVLALITIGFALAGIIGAILALPLASIIRDLFRLFFDKAVDESLVMEPPGDADRPGGPPAGGQTNEGPTTV
jgi:predicted PurR-regulated permease PerM